MVQFHNIGTKTNGIVKIKHIIVTIKYAIVTIKHNIVRILL